MKDDIDSHLFPGSLNIDDVGKYGKFVEFDKDLNDLLTFHTEALHKEKYTNDDGYLAINNMFFTLQDGIEKELEVLLQDKISEIQRKAKERIEKLKTKPREKLRKKYNYYEFLDVYARPDSEEES